jgi:hypothetical protein
MRAVRLCIFVPALTLIVVGGFFLYLSYAFPHSHASDFSHLKMPDELTDCFDCHARTTPVAAQDWKASKHGVLLVKCAVCHGDSSGQGSIPFEARPAQDKVCFKCHEPAIKRMQTRFGNSFDNCADCHPRHQNPLHKGAFEFAQPSSQTNL